MPWEIALEVEVALEIEVAPEIESHRERPPETPATDPALKTPRISCATLPWARHLVVPANGPKIRRVQ